MALFGRKKAEKEIPQPANIPKLPTIEDLNQVKAVVTKPVETLAEKTFQPIPAKTQLRQQITQPARMEAPKPKEETHAERPVAPLFIKLDRYKSILSTISNLKTSIIMLRNNFAILTELDRLREENLKLIQETLEKVENRLMSLDTELIRPSGFREETPEFHDVQTIEATLVDLKGQIEQLKEELESPY